MSCAKSLGVEMIDAMKQVLEVLEENLVWFSTDTMIGKALRKKTESAITTLRQAIADAEKQEPVAWRHDMGEENGGWEYFEKASCDDCQPLYTHPPKREWVGLTDEDIEKLAVENGQATFLNDDEETGIIWFDGDATPFAQAIEAKLKKKNT